jgi:hypothetical protein
MAVSSTVQEMDTGAWKPNNSGCSSRLAKQLTIHSNGKHDADNTGQKLDGRTGPADPCQASAGHLLEGRHKDDPNPLTTLEYPRGSPPTVNFTLRGTISTSLARQSLPEGTFWFAATVCAMRQGDSASLPVRCA